jgi:phospholipase C
MDPISRRAFIGRASATVAAAGVAAAIPATIASAATTGHAPQAEHVTTGTITDQPVIAHVKDLGTGEISLYAGFDEITVHDRGLAHALARVSGGK